MKPLDNIAEDRLQKIKLIITDVDGVMTDGGITYTTAGEQILRFDAQDGAGIRAWCKMGGRFAFLTGRSSSMVAKRALELDIDACLMKVHDKLPEFHGLLEKFGVLPEETLYMGDDWPDFPCLKAAGIGVAVGDAVDEVVAVSDAVTAKNGGHGAVREVISILLKVQNKLDTLLEMYK